MVYISDCLVKGILSGRFDCTPSQGIKCHYFNLPTWVEQRLLLGYSCTLSEEAGLQSCWPAGEMQLFARSYAKCWGSHESASTEKRCLEVILPNHPLEHTRRRFPNCKKVPPFSVWGFKELMELDVCWSTASWDWRGTNASDVTQTIMIDDALMKPAKTITMEGFQDSRAWPEIISAQVVNEISVGRFAYLGLEILDWRVLWWE